jgi:galactose-1-phosphate uridylyltransferase
MPILQGTRRRHAGADRRLFGRARLIEQGPWQVRVIPNKFPAVENVRDRRPTRHDFYETRHGVGVHEVIIECPNHVTAFSQLDDHASRLSFPGLPRPHGPLAR